MRQQILADNELVAEQMGRLISQMAIVDPTRGTSDWQRLQSTIELIELPNDGFLCVVRADDGRLLCHPGLREKPELATMSPGLAKLHSDSGAQLIKDGQGSGWAQMPDGLHLVAVQDLPRMNAKVMAHQHDSSIRAAVNRLLRPVELVAAAVAVIVAMIGTWVAAQIVVRYENRLARINEGLESTVRRRTESLMRTRNAVIFGLAKLAEYRDTDTGTHLDRIRAYVMALAKRLREDIPAIDDQYISNLAVASSLHDIGKVAIPDSILLKPGRLDEEERQTMQRHAELGAECLEAIKEKLGTDDFLEMAHEIALHHHERHDGRGYPRRLKGDAIPLSARLVALSDVYDALRSQRVYKKGMSHEQTRGLIADGSGTQFHPLVVQAFLDVESEFQRISEEFGTDESLRSVDVIRAQWDDVETVVATEIE